MTDYKVVKAQLVDHDGTTFLQLAVEAHGGPVQYSSVSLPDGYAPLHHIGLSLHCLGDAFEEEEEPNVNVLAVVDTDGAGDDGPQPVDN